MTSFRLSYWLTRVAVTAIAGAAIVATVTPSQAQRASQFMPEQQLFGATQCVTDEGGGRYIPCDTGGN